MSREPEQVPERRRFFKELAVAGGAAALLAAGGRASGAEVGASGPSEDAKGYRLSEHVKAYYNTLRI